MLPVPRTKFLPPLPQRQIIHRAHLERWLQNELPASRLTLLSAPAGYGKTTLLSNLPALLPGTPIVWLALDEKDNDLTRFLSALGEALATLYPPLLEVVQNQLAASAGLLGGSPPLRQTLTLLINHLLQLSPPPFLLVIDDIHELTDPLIYEVLDDLLLNQPPQMHLVLSGRGEPPLHLNRLRARRQLAELQMSDLRFNLDESQQLLNGPLGLGLPPAEILDLHQKTEGWPAGLVLLTSRLRYVPDLAERQSVLRRLKPVDSSTFHYLADEVFAQQPPEIASFLLETSILADLTPSQCQALTGRAHSGELLNEIHQRNLFLTLVREHTPEEEPIYRYQALFGEFLRYELELHHPARCQELHRRAAQVEKDPQRTIAHWLAAQEWLEAARVIETAGESYLQKGFQETVFHWIQALPPGVREGRFHLAYLLGLASLLRGSLNEAQHHLERCLELLAPGLDDLSRGKALVHLASLAFVQADFTRCARLITQAEQSLTGLPQPVDFLMLRASLALFYQSDWARAWADLQAAVKVVSASQDPYCWYLMALYLGPEFCVLPGATDLLENFCQEAQKRFGEPGSPLRLGIEDTWAGIHLRRGRLAQAIQMAQDALLVKKQVGGYPFLGINAALTAAAACTGLGRYAEADEYLSQAIYLVQESDLNRALTGGAYYPLGHLRWLEGRLDEAAVACRQLSELEQRLPVAGVLQKMLAGLLSLTSRQYARAETELLEAVRLQKEEWVSEMYGSARLLLAYLYLKWEKPAEALFQFDHVLARTAPGVLFSDMPLAAPLLRLALQKGQNVRAATALLEQMGLPLEEKEAHAGPLTERQLEILRLMAEGYSNQKIAETLVLSLATVKSHVVHIMDRLGVSSRLEAVARARQQGLL